MARTQRRLPVGAEVQSGGTHFRVWAPASKSVAVLVGEKLLEPTAPIFYLEAEGNGYHSGLVPNTGHGTLYKLRLDAGAFPDPASRFQPEGVDGPSQVIDPGLYPWSDAAWQGLGREGQVIYELHLGTFTPEGTWRAAAEQLEELAALGITILEIMPVSEFPGRFGWGYDGVHIFAPTRLYGSPDDFRAFVDRAHAVGLGVILDVVYNHFGPDGCNLSSFSPDYFTDRHKNDWGDSINFDGENNAPVREFFVANAGYWIDEYHLDGLRLDATQAIVDSSADHILTAISCRVREVGGRRGTYIVNENEPQDVRLVRPTERGGHGMDGLWNDDFHHSAIVAMTGRNEAYYCDYLGSPQEFISLAKYGFLYQGQRYQFSQASRGTPSLNLHPSHFVTFTQNHDQVANSLHGRRIHELTSPGVLRAVTALLLLGPATPMLFMGQEFAASSPFLYFADHRAETAAMVATGRRGSLERFPSTKALGDALKELLDLPHDAATFNRCKLDFAEREKNAATYRLHRDLLALRKHDPVFAQPRRGGVDGAVLSDRAFVLRFFGTRDGDDRLLLVNLGTDLRLDPAPEPLLAPPESGEWEVIWSSENPIYNGSGSPALGKEENWRLVGQAASVLRPRS